MLCFSMNNIINKLICLRNDLYVNVNDQKYHSFSGNKDMKFSQPWSEKLKFLVRQ